MTQYVNPAGEYPRYYGDIILENPGWKLGDDLPNGWMVVQDSNFPAVGDNQVLFEESPIEIDGDLFRNFKVRDLTKEEIQIREDQISIALSEEQ